MDLPEGTVRGNIRAFIELHSGILGDNVLECGSRIDDPHAWWVNNRYLAKGAWTGVDFQDGPNVDHICDIEKLPPEWTDEFTGVLCSEVMEHLRRPQRALSQLYRVMQPGAGMIVTTLTDFPIHSYPDDYRRWTESGLRVELEDAGFLRIETAQAGFIKFSLCDHGEERRTIMDCPIHVFATAFKPE